MIPYSSQNILATQRFGSAAAAGPARLFLNYALFLANRAGFRAAEPLSAAAGVGRRITSFRRF
jgi:hypothetical protein